MQQCRKCALWLKAGDTEPLWRLLQLSKEVVITLGRSRWISGTEDPALGDRWDVISKWREGAIFGFAKHCVYTDAQHPLPLPQLCSGGGFHLRVYKIDQCLSREARTTDRIHCLTSKYFSPVPLGSDFVTWVRVWQRTSFKHPTALWFDVRHLVKHASQLQPRLLCLP